MSLASNNLNPVTMANNQALEWLVIHWSGEISAQERYDWQMWLDASPTHAEAWQHVQKLQSKLQDMPAEVANLALRGAPASAKRRKLIQLMGLLLTAGVSAKIIGRTDTWQSYTADYRTGTGEQRHLTLSDGTSISLNTTSAVDVRFNAHERRIWLREGEILVATARENSSIYRPFIVETRHGTAEALGTNFNVRQIGEQSRVAVFEGAVEIVPNQYGKPLRLDAGQQASFSGSTISAIGDANSNDNAWLEGQLIAERMRLVDFLAELNRYRSGFIRCENSVAELIVSGVFPLQDTDRILHSLINALPIRVDYATRYWVTVSASTY